MSAHSELIEDLLRLAVESGASDIVIKAGKPGFVRLSGRLKPVDMDIIAEEEVRAFVEEVIPPSFRRGWEQDGQVDFSYVAEDIGRFRVNAFRQRGQVSIVFRHIKNRVPTIEDLNLSVAQRGQARAPRWRRS
jgi:twitching motility protein PilT